MFGLNQKMISRIDLVGQNGNTGEHYMSENNIHNVHVKEQEIIADLLEVMGAALNELEWQVTEENSPYAAIDRAEILLTRAGWTRDKRTNVWVKI